MLISGCILQKNKLPENFTLTSAEDLENLLLENDGEYDYERHFGYPYRDKYGNGFVLGSYLRSGPRAYYLSLQLENIPDLKVLLQLRNYIRELSIINTSPITDIAFLEHLQKLEVLYIGSPNITSLEPIGKLSGLRSLRIDNEYPMIVDCSIFTNLNYLNSLILSTDRILNLNAIFDKSQEIMNSHYLKFIKIGEYSLDKRKPGNFLANVKRLSPRDLNERELYGNSRGENYVDQYGNRFDNNGYGSDKVSVRILNTPDVEVLSSLNDYISSLTIENTYPLTNLDFLSNLTKLNDVRVITTAIESFEPLKNSSYLSNLSIINPSLEALESLKRLNHLSYLKIALSLNRESLAKYGNKNVLDFLTSYKDVKNLKKIIVEDIELNDFNELYSLAHEMFKVSNLQSIELGNRGFGRDDRISYNFELGKYHILQYRANVRSSPGLNSSVIAILRLHDEIEIIENTFIEEFINNEWGFWYKIKYGNITGYTFGGNIAFGALETDIDKNGIKDYFYFRYSAGFGWGYIEPSKDVFIYINGQRVNTNILSDTERSFNKPFDWCIFEEHDGYVLIGLNQYGRHDYVYQHVFKVTPDGNIEYLYNWDEIDYW
jgi:hypothetical protein